LYRSIGNGAAHVGAPAEVRVLTMYTTTWCGDCHRLKAQLDREGIEYTAIDIEQDAAAERFVLTATGGVQTIPTVRFEDGSVLIDPTIVDVMNHLARLPRQRPV
jgi:mycoredoxin